MYLQGENKVFNSDLTQQFLNLIYRPKKNTVIKNINSDDPRRRHDVCVWKYPQNAFSFIENKVKSRPWNEIWLSCSSFE